MPLRSGVGPVRALLADERGPTLTRSEAERRLLKLIAAAELPRPQVNTRVQGFEVDALWREQRLIVEVDGYVFHGPRPVFERDRRRDQVLIAAGYRVLRVTWRQLEHGAPGGGGADRSGAQSDRRLEGRRRRRALAAAGVPAGGWVLQSGSDWHPFLRMRYWDAVLSFAVAAALAWALTPLAARLARTAGRHRPAPRPWAGRARDAASGRAGDPGRRAGGGGDLAARRDPAAPHRGRPAGLRRDGLHVGVDGGRLPDRARRRRRRHLGPPTAVEACWVRSWRRWSPWRPARL